MVLVNAFTIYSRARKTEVLREPADVAFSHHARDTEPPCRRRPSRVSPPPTWRAASTRASACSCSTSALPSASPAAASRWVRRSTFAPCRPRRCTSSRRSSRCDSMRRPPWRRSAATATRVSRPRNTCGSAASTRSPWPADARSPHDGAEGRVAYQPLGDGDTIAFGRATLVAAHVPGHTLGSLALLADGALALSGDFLFVRSVGRPDLGGERDAWAAR